MNAILSRLNSGGGAMIQSLGSCDVKVDGMCCYFPSFCDPIAKCTSATPSSLIDLPSTFPRCTCPDGYQGDGRMKGSGCTNINECEMGSARCSQICIDLIPGFRCECRPGFRLEHDGRTCRDVDECAEHTHSCSHLCHNTLGSFQCDCPPGYYLAEDNQTCIDIDECSEANIAGTQLCPYQELCVNTVGGYECGCPPGLQPVQQLPHSSQVVCEDIDECFYNSNACPNGRVDNKVTQICENIWGGHLCRCLPGLKPVYRAKASEAKLGTAERTAPRHSRALLSADTTLRTTPEVLELVEYEDSLEHDSDGAHEPKLRISPLREPGTGTGSLRHPLSRFDSEIEAGSFQFGKKGTQDDIWATPTKTGKEIGKRHAEVVGQETGELLSAVEVQELKSRTKALMSEDINQKRKKSVVETRERFNWASRQREVLQCEDVDECEGAGTEICGADAVCVNTFRSYECRCLDENLQYDPDRKICTAADQIPRNRVCPPTYCAGPCVLTANAYYCGCPRGYTALDSDKWDQVSTSNVNAKSEADFQRAVEASVKCVDLDECAVNAHVCGVGCRCRNKIGTFECICDENKKKSSEPLDEDYDILLAVSNQFSEAVDKMGTKEELIRAMNHNGPRYSVMGLTSLKTAPVDEMSFNADRWLIDQVDWSKSEYLDLPSDYEAELVKLLNSEELVRDFIRTTASALRRSTVNVCAASAPCQTARCPANKPCCQEHDREYQCVPYASTTFFNKRKTCPPSTRAVPS